MPPAMLPRLRVTKQNALLLQIQFYRYVTQPTASKPNHATAAN